MKRALALPLILLACAPLAGCGGGSSSDEGGLTIYSGRNEKLVGKLIAEFEKKSGVETKVRYADSAELAATIEEEGGNSPADVFFSQDAGSLGSIEDKLGPLPPASASAVAERFRDPGGRWVGTSARARVVAFGTERLKEAEVPDSVFDYTEPEWRGRIGLPPSNASFQAFVSAMRIDVGDERTREWLEAIKRNKPKIYENNIQTIEAIGRGEIDVGFVNHYYLHELRREQPDLPVENHFLRDGDPGALVNAAGVAILSTSERKAEAQKFVDFLLSQDGQRYFRDETGEYPLAAGVKPLPDLPPLRAVVGPKVKLGELGRELRATLKMLDEVGLTS